MKLFKNKKQKNKEKSMDSNLSLVKESCETILNASEIIEEAKIEKSILKIYYEDVLLLDGIPQNNKEEIFSLAKKISSLNEEREEIEKSSVKIEKDKYEYVRKNEKAISKSIERMTESEKRLSLVKSDLNKLEGEREALKVEKRELKNKLNVLQNTSKLAIILLMIVFVICIILDFVFEFDSQIIILVSIGLAIIAALLIFIFHRKILYNIKLTDIKLNKIISLLNKVKIKYVNVMSTLDYVYEKNKVNSSYELSSLWGNYITSQKDKEIYDKVLDRLYNTGEKLIDLLSSYNLKEPEIWISGAGNMTDESSFQKYKEEIKTQILEKESEIIKNNKDIEDSKENIKKLMQNDNVEPEEIIRIVEQYEDIL